MTVKKCDKCGKVYTKGFTLSYSLDPYEAGECNAVLRKEYAEIKDLCETCSRRLKMFIGRKIEDSEVKK